MASERHRSLLKVYGCLHSKESAANLLITFKQIFNQSPFINVSQDFGTLNLREEEVELVLPTTALRTLNSSKLEEVLQWVAYYASK